VIIPAAKMAPLAGAVLLPERFGISDQQVGIERDSRRAA